MLLWFLQDYTSFKNLIKASASFLWGYTLQVWLVLLTVFKFQIKILLLLCYLCLWKALGYFLGDMTSVRTSPLFPETVTFPSSVSYLINIPLSHQRGSFTENLYLLQVYNSVEFINEFPNLEIIKICTVSLFNTIWFWKYP